MSKKPTAKPPEKPAAKLAETPAAKPGAWETIAYAVEGHFLADTEQIGVITLNRPAKLNAIGVELVKEMNEALDKIEKDPNIRAVIIRSAAEKAFSVGADLGAAAQLAQDMAKGRQFLAAGQALFRRIENSSKPFVAELNGIVYGGGLEMAMACDVRIAAKGARLGNPEVKVGLLPAWGGTQRMPKLVGLGRAKEYMMTGKDIPAEEAVAVGLVNKVVEPSELHAEALFMAQQIADNAPIAVAMTKKTLNMAFSVPIEKGNEAELEACIKCFQTEDITSGITAVFSKAKAKFKGK